MLEKLARLSSSKPSQPNILDFMCFRAYLKAYEEFARTNLPDFSHRKFARAAGFSTSSLLRMLIDGKSNLSNDGAKRVAKALGLTSDGRAFFCALVEYNQAKTPLSAKIAYQKILRIEEFRRRHPLAESQLRYFTHWYYPVIRELISPTGVPDNAEAISKRLEPCISKEAASEAISDLISLGLLDSKNGTLYPVAAIVTTGTDVASQLYADFYRQTLDLAIRSLESMKADSRDLRSLTLRMDPARLPELKRALIATINSIVETFEAGAESRCEVYQLNLLAFPVTKSNLLD